MELQDESRWRISHCRIRPGPSQTPDKMGQGHSGGCKAQTPSTHRSLQSGHVSLHGGESGAIPAATRADDTVPRLHCGSLQCCQAALAHRSLQGGDAWPGATHAPTRPGGTRRQQSRGSRRERRRLLPLQPTGMQLAPRCSEHLHSPNQQSCQEAPAHMPEPRGKAEHATSQHKGTSPPSPRSPGCTKPGQHPASCPGDPGVLPPPRGWGSCSPSLRSWQSREPEGMGGKERRLPQHAGS